MSKQFKNGQKIKRMWPPDNNESCIAVGEFDCTGIDVVLEASVPWAYITRKGSDARKINLSFMAEVELAPEKKQRKRNSRKAKPK